MIRWYSACCKTPIGNVMPSSKFPYVGVIHSVIDVPDGARPREQILGPIHWRIHGKFGIGTLPPGTLQGAPLSLIINTIQFVVFGLLRRKNKPSPFFDLLSGQPVVAPLILADSEYEALRKRCGPHPS